MGQGGSGEQTLSAQPLYDLSPVLHVMIMGALLALGPLAWIWVRNKQVSVTRRLQALTLLTLFLTFDLVMFGAFTRLTDSGLGCPDWPGCYGSASPVGASAHISAAQSAMPSGPVTHGKAWIEMIHRYLATGVGVLILVLAAASWAVRRRATHSTEQRAAVHPWLASLTLVWVCIQGAFGALTVTMKLFPAIVTLHLLGGVMLLALLCMQAVRYHQAHQASPLVAIGPGTRTLLGVTSALLWIQIALGGWVSTNYAVLACTDFPRCQASWWPSMDFVQGFEIWRELGLTGAGEHIAFEALTAIHVTHRLFAVLVLLALGLLAWRLRSAPGLAPQTRLLAGLAALQLLTGLSNVVLDWPLLAAVLHTGGAAALVVALTWTACVTTGASRLSAHPLTTTRTGSPA
ncbi:COX15/CtaA family protein [Rhodoferax sp.]|uniref:COX15/CtaA family protein n=1 Tax=Rhodoferax sp. TaxID=50421 RepID=UPI002766BE9E|nr:COX15/CtaA family protein [Rhodoferax sp.]